MAHAWKACECCSPARSTSMSVYMPPGMTAQMSGIFRTSAIEGEWPVVSQ
jgi:hypothetical protein